MNEMPNTESQASAKGAPPASRGTIFALQLCPGYRKAMNAVDEAEAIAGLGLKGDQHALPESARQVLLIEKETLLALGIGPGDVKENITTVGIDLMSLAGNTRLQLGSAAILEITKPCAPCSRMEEIRPGFIREIAGKRGMLARVVNGGRICRGDVIRVLA